jgi:hypothetical protein
VLDFGFRIAISEPWQSRLGYAHKEIDYVAKKSGKGSKYRSAKSGQYVTKKYGQTHKSTTVKETK